MDVTRRRTVAVSAGGFVLPSGCSASSDPSTVIVDNTTDATISGSVELINPSDSSTVLSERFTVPSEERVAYDISVCIYRSPTSGAERCELFDDVCWSSQ
jgi:hypothetical protein